MSRNALLSEDWGPTVSRIDSFLLGGSEHYERDREVAVQLPAAAPWLRQTMKINGAHRPRAVQTIARNLGIRQFVDLGCGLPPRWNRQLGLYDPGAPVYDAARLVHDAPRVVYVDNDPMVGGFARVVLDEHPTTAAVEADIRDSRALFDHPAIAALDRGRPIAVLLHDVLPWMTDAAAHRVMAALREWLPPGSAISLTHASTDWAPGAMQDLVDIYAAAGITYQPRALDEITALLSPWNLLPPGAVPTSQWRSASASDDAAGGHSHAYAAVITNGLGTA